MRANLTTVRWRTSSYSGGTGNCVEVGTYSTLRDSRVTAVRDSKDPEGSALSLDPDAWTAFAQMVKAGAYDL
ncbi:DUF397 domain-containing protein [Actinomadura sp. 9N407]|uniref:DUF397 domain-containing protein n=1 Tax=Actinomadura sp. 9N407 TaxID=3375154 RepID=UPI003793EB74